MSTKDKNTIVKAINEIYNNFQVTGLGSNNLTARQWSSIVKSQELPLTFYTNWDNKGEIPTKYGSGIIIPGLDAAYKFILHIGNDGGDAKNYYVGILYIPYDSNEPYRLTWEKIITDKKLSELISNPNLLINPDFKINQRKHSSYTAGKYTVDRWYCVSGKMEIDSNGKVSFLRDDANNWGLYYHIFESLEPFCNKTVTVSFQEDNGVIYSRTFDIPDLKVVQYDSPQVEGYNFNVDLYRDTSNNPHFSLRIFTNKRDDVTSCSMNWIKMEYGSMATMYIPPNPTEELIKCKRYYNKIDSNRFGYTFNDKAKISVSEEARIMRVTPTLRLENEISGETVDLTICPIGKDSGYNIGVSSPQSLIYNKYSDMIIIQDPIIKGEIISNSMVQVLLDSECYFELDAEIY